jgi:hypothetical protein
MIICTHRLLASLVCAAPLLMAGCSMPRIAMPHIMGLGSYYAVTDDATGRVYYTDNLSREPRGVIEFETGLRCGDQSRESIGSGDQ